MCNVNGSWLFGAALIGAATLVLLEVSASNATPADVTVDQLIQQMTLEEKAGQLSQSAMQDVPTGPLIPDSEKDDPALPPAGSYLIGAFDTATTRQLQRVALQHARLPIPLLLGYDVIHGYRTIFPVPLAEAASWDPDLARRSARAAAVEASASGIHWNYAPMVDITRDPRWGRVVEGAGEDPFLGSAMAVARIRGFHGEGSTDPTSLLTTAKHFVAYGAPEGGRDYNTADLSERTLREIYLPPFRAAVEAGVDAVMPGFNELAGIPMHANRPLLHDLLRNEWGFRGLIVGDYDGVGELRAHGLAHDAAEAALQALTAGVDIDMASVAYARHLARQVRENPSMQPLLDSAVRRVLEAKQRLGLLDQPYRYSDPARAQASLTSPDTRHLAREAGRKAIVLLKNDGALLPLDKHVRTLAVVGALADDAGATLGPWHGNGRAEESVSILQGIRHAVSPGTRVLYTAGASPKTNDLSGIDTALQMIADADAVVAVLGETPEMSGEGRNRASLGLPGAQDALLVRLIESQKPLVVVLMNGRPLATPALVEQVPAIIESWFLGSEMGNAVADVLFGDENPSGKLPMTVPRAVGQLPLYYNHKNTGRPMREGDHFSSQYLDMAQTPLFPFGFGLSYTTFSYSPLQLSHSRLGPHDSLTVSVTVGNTGSRAGEDVVQLYLRDDIASVTRPVRALRGFQRIKLAPGESRTFSFLLDEEDFALLDAEFKRVVEAGTFTVFVGGDSTTDNQARFEVTSSARLVGPGSAIPRMLRHPSTPR